MPKDEDTPQPQEQRDNARLADLVCSHYTEAHGTTAKPKVMVAWAWGQDLITAKEALGLPQYMRTVGNWNPGGGEATEPAEPGEPVELGDGGTGEAPDLGGVEAGELGGSEDLGFEGDGVEDDREEGADGRFEGRACAGDGQDGAEQPGPDSPFEQLWESLTDNQKKVAQEYLFTSTKAEAANNVGLAASTVYAWPDKVWEAAGMLVDQRKDGITEGISALSPAALDVLRRALSPDESVSRVESETAQYLINQLEGKPTQKQQVEHSGGIDFDPQDEQQVEDLFKNLDAGEED